MSSIIKHRLRLNELENYCPPFERASNKAWDFWQDFRDIASRESEDLHELYEDKVDWMSLDKPVFTFTKDLFPLTSDGDEFTDARDLWDMYVDNVMKRAESNMSKGSKEEDAHQDQSRKIMVKHTLRAIVSNV